MAKHDENKDLRLFSRIGKVNIGSKTLKASKSTIIGIRMWGRIDYLTHYCGYHFIWDNSISSSGFKNNEDKPKGRELKKKAKEPKLTNKKNKR